MFILIGELWSLASPLNGGPDERVQIIKAAAVVRGEWLGGGVPGQPAYTRVDVPESYANLGGSGGCFIGKPATPAGSCRSVGTSSRAVSTTTYVGHYPPLYYLLIGWPSYIAATWSVYLVRLASVVVNSVFLALAVAAAYRWSRSLILLPALAVAVTPTVVFFMGVVNPSSLEMTAGITMWTAAVVLVTGGPDRPAPVGLLATLTASVCVEILVRGDSFLWVIACAAVLIPIAVGRGRIGADALRFAKFVSVPFVAVSGIAAVVWMFVGHPLRVVPLGVPAPSTPTSLLAREIVGGSGLLLRQVIGYFGWMDTPAPRITYLIWYGLIGALLSTALVVGGRRHLTSLALAVVAACVGPFIVALVAFRSTGPLLQGRYYLALVAGVPIVAGSISTQAGLPRRPAARLAIGILALAAAGQIAAGYWALRRYLVGSDGPLSPLDTVPGVWHPPLPAWLTDLGFVVLWAAVLWLAVRLVRTQGTQTSGQPSDVSLSFLSTRL